MNDTVALTQAKEIASRILSKEMSPYDGAYFIWKNIANNLQDDIPDIFCSFSVCASTIEDLKFEAEESKTDQSVFITAEENEILTLANSILEMTELWRTKVTYPQQVVIPPGWTKGLSVGAFLVFLGFLFMTFYSNLTIIYQIIAVGLFIFGVLGLLDSLTTKIVFIDDTLIVYKNLRRQTINSNDIAEIKRNNGAPIFIKLFSGQIIFLPESINSNIRLESKIRAWHKKTRRRQKTHNQLLKTDTG